MFDLVVFLLLATEAEKHISQLGNEEYSAREQSSKELENLGVPALWLLKLAEKHEDFEVKARAERIIRHIELNDPLLVNKRIKELIDKLDESFDTAEYNFIFDELVSWGDKALPLVGAARKSTHSHRKAYVLERIINAIALDKHKK